MKRIIAISALLVTACADAASAATRLKDLVSVEGVRDNQLMGYGLVVGLAGTGDRRQTVFSAQSLTNLLQRMGLTVPGTAIQVRNTAAVMVTATLPPYGQPGARIDVTVAAIGDASSVQGGILLMTGLQGPDGQVYAVAQGAAVVGGYVAGSGGTNQVVNHPTVGRLPNGAIIERPAPSAALGANVNLQLHRADFTTAARIAEALNKRFGKVAHAENSALVAVAIPSEFATDQTVFMAEMERITVESDRAERIVVNERTGTIVMGKDMVISPVAIMQGTLTVEIQTTMNTSQPNALSTGTTQTTPQTSVGVKETAARNLILKEGATVEELVRALGTIGSTPRDIIALLQNLKAAGALDAELEVI
jgi:flagellar P-ring protein FlgI